ncbi:glycosyltransferase family 2 protein [Lysinibacter sp. HNR]|uniref:glycosyltransferase family 2 protein n=1 Tax=Lysinibacter sp. HNR TaxID=3031408 RepID=UPI002434D310|nr:glycosyltransferase family 2 protein [Lysinibacter sp. HNR]WGD38073.1 glycosyltransferase family 2 protein [Lysinibacter sp. HNR]
MNEKSMKNSVPTEKTSFEEHVNNELFMLRSELAVIKGVGQRSAELNAEKLQNIYNELENIRVESQRKARLQEAAQAGILAIAQHHEWHLDNIRSVRDDTDANREKLAAMRLSPEYESVFEDREPLITVRIASYTKTEELIDVAIASVQRQTYENLEIVIVNDGPNEKTAQAIKKLGNKRIRYFELEQRSAYPENPHNRWMVAGSPGMNRAVELAQGDWIAPLDDDDAFTPDHLEKLLELAHTERAELAYGALIQKNVINGEENRIWSFPPSISQFSFQGAMYLKLMDFFRYDEQSWIVQEPGDWNLIRRMSLAGVKMAAIKDIVAVMYATPYTHKESS